MNEIKETAIWLINILGMLAIVVGGILMKSATWLIIGGIMCTIYYIITALRNWKDKRRSAVVYLIMALTLLGIIAAYLLTH
ncbi:MAG: hypothetical protein UC300_03980 [Prevotella sp.]|jgi:hypothetical protein|nr:hypothetical protein [Prevotella sp.]